MGTTRYYPHYDGVGNVIALTGEDQRVKALYNYATSWGAEALGSDSVGFANRDRARWKGALWLGTDLYYLRNRWYDAYTGRFLSEDPIGLAGGINPYVFAGDDPVNGSDPTGLQGDEQCPSWGCGPYTMPGVTATGTSGWGGCWLDPWACDNANIPALGLWDAPPGFFPGRHAPDVAPGGVSKREKQAIALQAMAGPFAEPIIPLGLPLPGKEAFDEYREEARQRLFGKCGFATKVWENVQVNLAAGGLTALWSGLEAGAERASEGGVAGFLITTLATSAVCSMHKLSGP